MAEMTLSPSFLSWLIEEARAFELDDLAPDVDGDEVEEVSAGGDTRSQIASAIEGLSEREQAELVALVWTGRAIEEGQDPDDFDELVALAQAEHVNATSTYLLGMPLLPDYLTEAAAKLEIEIDE